VRRASGHGRCPADRLTPARWSAKPSHGVAPARERRSSFGLWLAAVGLCAIVLSLAGPRLVFSERGAAATAPTVSSVAADGVSAGHRPGFAPNRDAAVRQAAAAGDLSAQTAAEALSLSEEVRRTDADPLTEPRHQQAAFSSFGSSRPALSPAALPGGIPSGP